MSCEIFEKNQCTGCVGLEYDIDKLKLECEMYKNIVECTKGEHK